MEFAYVEPTQAEDMSLAFLSGCRIRAWVIPNGSAPFTMPNWNEGQNFLQRPSVKSFLKIILVQTRLRIFQYGFVGATRTRDVIA